MHKEPKFLSREQIHEVTREDPRIAEHVAWAEKTHVEDEIALEKMRDQAIKDAETEHQGILSGDVEDDYRLMSNALSNKELGLIRATSESRNAGAIAANRAIQEYGQTRNP